MHSQGAHRGHSGASTQLFTEQTDSSFWGVSNVFCKTEEMHGAYKPHVTSYFSAYI